MYELRDDVSHLIISDDLHWLEFGRGRQQVFAQEPFQLDWTGIPVSLATCGYRKIERTKSVLTIDVGDFSFPARFPGNDYCRPDKRYVPDFRIALTISLNDGDLVVELSPIENLGDCEVKLLICAPFFTASSLECVQLVLPVDYGIRIDFPRAGSYATVFQPSVAWSLPVHGLFRPSGGIGLWCEDPDREIAVAFNAGASTSVSAVCHQLYGPAANTSRSLRFMLFERGSDFQVLARRCRHLRQDSGRFKTLKQKILDNPEVAQLPGTVFWKHNVYYGERPAGVEKSYSLYVARPTWNENEGLPNNWTAEEIFRTASERGGDRVAVCNTGWNRDGFDAGYPVRLTTNPQRGTVEDIRKAVSSARQLCKGYFLSVHDNYIDAYGTEEFHLDETLQTCPGLPCKTAVWRGGQAHWLCSQKSLKYAERDLPKIADLMGRGCIYLDVMAAVALSPCFA